MKHGAKVKRCSVEGCLSIVQKGGVCMKHGAKKEQKRCSIEGCTNKAQKGGVCIKHGAKKKHTRCSREGCTSFAQKGGVCIKHGAKVNRCGAEGCTNNSKRGGLCRRHSAYRNNHDESTAFASCFGSEYDKTTVTHPSQRGAGSSSNQGNFPEEVVLCKE